MKSFNFTIDGRQFETTVEEMGNNMAQVTVNGMTFDVEISREGASAPVARPAAKPAAAPVAQAAPVATQAAGNQVVKSPLPGSIVKVMVKEGDKVNVGDTLLTMESMKMENVIKSEYAGTITSVSVTPGQNVMQDDKLVEIATVAVAAAPAAAPVAPKAAPVAPKAAPAPAAAPKAAAPAGGIKVCSPLPGSVIKVVVSEGQAVKKGDVLLTLESMKMENAIAAEQDGTVKQICVSAGQNVMQDDLLVVLG